MADTSPGFTIGIEEEYLLVDLTSRQLAADPPEALFQRCSKILPDMVTHEFLRAQIEVGTPVCESLQEARQQLSHLRSSVAEVAAGFGLGLIAASSHPFAHWANQQHTRLDRYDLLAEDLQGVVRRLLTCGMHVHVGIPDDDQRIDLMNQAIYFLPHLLALSTSSPFWGGDDTGLNSYRLSVFNELPRTGLPDRFNSFAEYQRHVDVLVKTGLIKDASMLWWDIRPSNNFPTLEMRITDVCTRLDDAISIAALYVSTMRMLANLRLNNQRWRQYAPMLIHENRWRAQRYGISEGLIDFGSQEKAAFSELLEEWLQLINQAALELGCSKEVSHARKILTTGTSADKQRAIYQQATNAGHSHEDALQKVVDWLIDETINV
ncbi:carboxylate-amine ligase [Motiliproteus sp. MSK22-1]|uniref:carboxylate-amine ligase n=1 Tax=Motiliproteus sp. MSK22-1 TaxID=1897630 RepID=UPI0009758204|nr:carboxylate-amine ligase [Motiliproteus sp. MSK22-1]OMH30250.1 carboxylate-amine ligase [Motiliproteus sp. MSK22-1]